ncbi:DNA-binding transcriptional response regulator, NtrC family, contains REC, AAA-type ATPase, and a Fis-type DNA-binding domains [Hymenobacter daecheongensis DSM 21074]|uniref:DNA-binding transcriptional response regulator, NtrC family, contains REC, AAA-type ATPase, and a Fis-type DNA-binding domains n=1 Tax=Hymenobacter daecheongensis DSM 21074 TaxID=1121955 RepID=A0A1M6ESV1_9BACT|nr:sigma-54 dependent transcriptional regulator [Hymenobacter daecheongensis]SHI88552.1 DNA-binding transcriptional response regulator, NtrC family, contains REC, AAA-type ATPase, and a Fis-type DNA-binding domains [Hymenobacter daecheongensis DSM 21074]
MPRILIIDDEKAIRNTLKEILEYESYTVDQAEDGPSGLDLMIKNKYDVVLCDIKMPKMDGLEVLERAQLASPDSAFIMISAHGNIETAVDATKKGAFDFIQKPPDLNRLLVTVRNALDRTKLVTETKTLKKKIAKSSEMIGTSAQLEQVRKQIAKVAPTDARVLITGPNGAGKEMVARQLHELSNRNNGPLIEVNCAAIPSELIESELFGHEKGSFTSAVKQRIGKFEQADGGTLFLDEIGDMSLSAQAKVLRALQESKITRVGGEKEITVNVRVIAATNKDLQQEIAERNFREDLYHRLSVILIKVPALNDRRDDIPDLVQRFLHDIARDYGDKPKNIDPAALDYLTSLDWRGNIRELRNVVERLIIMSDETITEPDAKTYAGK